jgi:hypothetical protein
VLEKRVRQPRIRRTMSTYIKLAYAFLDEDCQTFGELLKKTGLSKDAVKSSKRVGDEGFPRKSSPHEEESVLHLP